jgi:hypothetical protein
LLQLLSLVCAADWAGLQLLEPLQQALLVQH